MCNDTKIKKLHIIAWFILITYLFISIVGVIYQPLDDWSARIVNRNYNGEGLIETIEAICWLSAAFIYALIFFRIYNFTIEKFTKLWMVFFVLLCFVAFGEEISWGQHIFELDVPEYVQVVNQQNEINIHNLNMSRILGLSENDFFYKYLRNFNVLLNPIFYFVCLLMWVVFPLIKKNALLKNRLIHSMPQPTMGTIIFCGVNVLIYLVIDKLFYDVGEIFELSLALTGLLSAVDAYLKWQGRLQPQTRSR